MVFSKDMTEWVDLLDALQEYAGEYYKYLLTIYEGNSQKFLHRADVSEQGPE